jgi:hypothetical protein
MATLLMTSPSSMLSTFFRLKAGLLRPEIVELRLPLLSDADFHRQVLLR